MIEQTLFQKRLNKILSVIPTLKIGRYAYFIQRHNACVAVNTGRYILRSKFKQYLNNLREHSKVIVLRNWSKSDSYKRGILQWQTFFEADMKPTPSHKSKIFRPFVTFSDQELRKVRIIFNFSGCLVTETLVLYWK